MKFIEGGEEVQGNLDRKGWGCEIAQASKRRQIKPTII